MKNHIKRIKRVLFVSLLVLLPLYSVSPVLAGELRTQQSSDVKTNTKPRIARVPGINPQIDLRFVQPRLEILSVKVYSRDGKLLEGKLAAEAVRKLDSGLTKKINNALKACSLEQGKGWDCFVECLGDFGVSAVQATICAATCIAGGPILCAICVGVTVTVIEFCGVGCALYAD